jgi:hypothetical protein
MIKKIVSRLKIKTTPELLTVSTIKEAKEYRHIGGPTVQVNGIDIEPAARNIEQFALA